MKPQNRLNGEKLITVLNFGDHIISPETIVDDIRKEIKDAADAFILRSKPEYPLDRECYRRIARMAKEEGLHFAILYAYQHPPVGKKSHLDKETVQDMINEAGELFMGEVFAETGTQYTAQDVGYYISTPDETIEMPPQGHKDMGEARKCYVKKLSEMLEYNKSIGIDRSIMVEPTAAGAYALEAGFDTIMLETLCTDPERLIPFTRGASIAYGKEEFGGFVAHEWYGGYDHEDPLKKKRLDLAYKYLYMQGANYIALESGGTEISSFGKTADYDSEICKSYRDFTKSFHAFAKGTKRKKHGPYTTFAFIYGDDDGYGGFLGSNAWCQFGDEKWGRGSRERSWQITEEVFRGCQWHDPDNYAGSGVDLSSAPPYGSFDVIPASAPIEVMHNYDILVFVGHNTMSTDLYEKLITYVQNGGTLLASCAHLTTSSDRENNKEFYTGGDFSRLFGTKIIGTQRINHGVKFTNESFVPGLRYPGTENLETDANLPSGYTDIARLALCGATPRAYFSDSFIPPSKDAPILCTEYKNGKGTAILMSHCDYPGAPEVYPIYKTVVKALLTAGHRNAEIKVFGCDKIRFSVFFDDDGNKTLYLLNTGFDVPGTVGVIYNGKTEFFTLDPCELKEIDL